MAKIVRLGDMSDHGGEMITAGSTVKVNGITMCVDQDMHSCPIRGHGITPVTGTASYKSVGKRGVKTGDKAGCGAVIIAGSGDSSTG